MTEERDFTAQLARQIFKYEDGRIFWEERPRSHFSCDRSWRRFNRHVAGTEVGTPNRYGYLIFGMQIGDRVRQYMVPG